MTTYTKHTLSGSTDGKNIVVSGSASPGVTIHTADTTALDEVWIYATNTSSDDIELTIEWGEITSPDGNIISIIPGKNGEVLLIPGFLLTNSLIIRAFASASPIIINGFINRIS